MTYSIEKRSRPKALRPRRKLFGVIPIGAGQDYKRPWMVLRDGTPVGYYETEAEAKDALPRDRD